LLVFVNSSEDGRDKGDVNFAVADDDLFLDGCGYLPLGFQVKVGPTVVECCVSELDCVCRLHHNFVVTTGRDFSLRCCFLLVVFCLSSIVTTLAASRGQKQMPAAATPASDAQLQPFSIQEQDAHWWLASPEGRRFFSLGVCCVYQGALRKSFDSENPGYAAWQQYDTPAAWADASLRRLKSWGFTTVGGWGDFGILRKSREETLYLAPVLHIGSSAGAPWLDMWDSKLILRMEEIAREQILRLRNDPRLLGYYSDNELGWWNATLWKTTLDQPSSSGQRRRLIQLLRDIYQDDWNKLRNDFHPENADSWSQLQRGGMLFLKSGGNGIHTMRRFLGLLAERYYQLMRDIIRKYDSRALFLGDRYQSFYYPEVARASARYVDAVSSNLNASWNDGSFPRCYLDTLHTLTSKPVLISEIYLAAAENRSGNKNTSGIYPVVATQHQRADAARNTLRALMRLPYVLGADWFQFADEPQHGRNDGENFNFGLVDINDHPYDEIAAMFAALNAEQLKAQPAPPRPDASSGIPPAPSKPFADFSPTRALKQWDRERGFVKSVSEHPLGDLYVCWSKGALYLGLYSFDMVESAYYRDSSVPKSDRALWMVRIDGREIARARIGAGREAFVSEPGVRIENLSGLNSGGRDVTALELPAKLLGRDSFKAGDAVELACTFLTHCRAYRYDWKGRFTLRE
jgi:hypothetical protein